MQQDVDQFVKKCDHRQRIFNIQHQPTASLTPISAPLAVRPVEDGYSWPLSSCIESVQIFFDSHQLLYKVDRSRASNPNNRNQSEGFHLKIYNLPL